MGNVAINSHAIILRNNLKNGVNIEPKSKL